MNKGIFAAGLAICVLSALLMILDVLSVGWGAAIGVIGVGIIGGASANRSGTETD